MTLNISNTSFLELGSICMEYRIPIDQKVLGISNRDILKIQPCETNFRVPGRNKIDRIPKKTKKELKGNLC